MAWTSLPWMWVIMADPFSMSGMFMVSVTVPTCDVFCPVKMCSSSILALADQCLPGLDLDILRILYASSSIATYLPIFSVLISALVVPGMSRL